MEIGSLEHAQWFGLFVSWIISGILLVLGHWKKDHSLQALHKLYSSNPWQSTQEILVSNYSPLLVGLPNHKDRSKSNHIIQNHQLSSLAPLLTQQRLALSTVLCCKWGQALVLLGLDCRSFCSMNAGTHQRAPWSPLGNQEYPSVQMGNLLCSRYPGFFIWVHIFQIWIGFQILVVLIWVPL